MLHRMFTVFDVKVGAYLQPFFLQADDQAVRAIGDCVNDPAHAFSKHPEDYTLFFLGIFDDNHASFSLLDAPTPLRKLIELSTFTPSMAPFKGNGPDENNPLGDVP